eukprot:scaffold4437_cov391-Prasinococcus_capsulatus_cf.AAC.3
MTDAAASLAETERASGVLRGRSGHAGVRRRPRHRPPRRNRGPSLARDERAGDCVSPAHSPGEQSGRHE